MFGVKIRPVAAMKEHLLPYTQAISEQIWNSYSNVLSILIHFHMLRLFDRSYPK
jgi:hypothetical protein